MRKRLNPKWVFRRNFESGSRLTSCFSVALGRLLVNLSLWVSALLMYMGSVFQNHSIVAVAFLLLGVYLGGLLMMERHAFAKTFRLKRSRNLPPSLKYVSNFADLFGLGLRKRIKAVAGEFDVEVKRLHEEKRHGMAKWNVILAWGYAVWYVLRGPYDVVKGALVKAMKGL